MSNNLTNDYPELSEALGKLGNLGQYLITLTERGIHRDGDFDALQLTSSTVGDLQIDNIPMEQIEVSLEELKDSSEFSPKATKKDLLNAIESHLDTIYNLIY